MVKVYLREGEIVESEGEIIDAENGIPFLEIEKNNGFPKPEHYIIPASRASNDLRHQAEAAPPRPDARRYINDRAPVGLQITKARPARPRVLTGGNAQPLPGQTPRRPPTPVKRSWRYERNEQVAKVRSHHLVEKFARTRDFQQVEIDERDQDGGPVQDCAHGMCCPRWRILHGRISRPQYNAVGYRTRHLVKKYKARILEDMELDHQS